MSTAISSELPVELCDVEIDQIDDDRLSGQAGVEPSVSTGRMERIRESETVASLLAIFDQALISGTNFVTAVLIGRCCGAESLGLYSLVAAAMAMTIGLQDQLITAPFILYKNRCRPKRLRSYSGSVLVHQTVMISLAVVAVGFLYWEIRHQDGLSSTIALILLICTPAILFRAFFRDLSLAHCDVISVLALDAAVCTAQLAVVGFLAWNGALSLPIIYVTLGIACTVAGGIWFARRRGDFRIRSKAIQIDAVRNWRFGRWALATHLAGTSTPYIMPWILFSMHGEAAAGTLAACSVIVGVANIMLAGMGDFLAPRAAAAFAKEGKLGLTRILRRTFVLISVAIGSVCVFGFVAGDFVIAALYDGKFPEAGGLVGILALAVLANAIGFLSGNGLWAIDRPRANFAADIVTLIVAIVGALLLVQPYAAGGAAAATLIASAAGAAVRHWVFKTELAKR